MTNGQRGRRPGRRASGAAGTGDSASVGSNSAAAAAAPVTAATASLPAGARGSRSSSRTCSDQTKHTKKLEELYRKHFVPEPASSHDVASLTQKSQECARAYLLKVVRKPPEAKLGHKNSKGTALFSCVCMAVGFSSSQTTVLDHISESHSYTALPPTCMVAAQAAAAAAATAAAAAAEAEAAAAAAEAAAAAAQTTAAAAAPTQAVTAATTVKKEEKEEQNEEKEEEEKAEGEEQTPPAVTATQARTLVSAPVESAAAAASALVAPLKARGKSGKEGVAGKKKRTLDELLQLGYTLQSTEEDVLQAASSPSVAAVILIVKEWLLKLQKARNTQSVGLNDRSASANAARYFCRCEDTHLMHLSNAITHIMSCHAAFKKGLACARCAFTTKLNLYPLFVQHLAEAHKQGPEVAMLPLVTPLASTATSVPATMAATIAAEAAGVGAAAAGAVSVAPAAPEVVAPEAVAPEVVAPEVIAPEVMAPEVVPEAVAPVVTKAVSVSSTVEAIEMQDEDPPVKHEDAQTNDSKADTLTHVLNTIYKHIQDDEEKQKVECAASAQLAKLQADALKGIVEVPWTPPVGFNAADALQGMLSSSDYYLSQRDLMVDQLKQSLLAQFDKMWRTIARSREPSQQMQKLKQKLAPATPVTGSDNHVSSSTPSSLSFFASASSSVASSQSREQHKRHSSSVVPDADASNKKAKAS